MSRPAPSGSGPASAASHCQRAPLLGGLLVQALGWRWVFAINAPSWLSLRLSLRLLRRGESRGDASRQGEPLDLPGTALAALTLAAVTFAVIDAGHNGPGFATGAGVVVAVLGPGGLSLLSFTPRPFLADNRIALDLAGTAESRRISRRRR